MKTKEEKFFYKIFDKMFKMVGFKRFDPKYTQKKNWFQTKEWSDKDANKFYEYFINTAKKDLKWSKKRAIRKYLWFDLSWGWKRKK